MLGWDPGRAALDETIGSDRLISLTRADEGRRYFSLDGLSSVVNLTNDSGSAVASYHLDAWGNFRVSTELAASKNRFAFTGHIFDQETGLYNAKARYFDPKLGRFLTQDSFLGQIDEPPSLHRYLYAANRPTFYVDPTGHGNIPGIAEGFRSLGELIWDKARGAHDFAVNTFGSVMYDLGQRTGLGGESFRSQYDATADVVVPARESAARNFQSPQHLLTAVVESNIERKQRYDEAFERGDLKAAQSEAIGFLSQVPAARAVVSPLTGTPSAMAVTPQGATVMVSTGVAANPGLSSAGILMMAGSDGGDKVSGIQGETGNYGPGGGAREPLPADKAPAQKPPHPGRRGNPDHVADVIRNNEPNNMAPGPVGARVPDGIAQPGQVVTIRGVEIDPGPDARVIAESERFRQSGQMVGEGRQQIRDIRAAEPESTIVCTDCARPDAPPVVYPPGTQPPPKGRLPRGTPTHVPFPE